MPWTQWLEEISRKLTPYNLSLLSGLKNIIIMLMNLFSHKRCLKSLSEISITFFFVWTFISSPLSPCVLCDAKKPLALLIDLKFLSSIQRKGKKLQLPTHIKRKSQPCWSIMSIHGMVYILCRGTYTPLFKATPVWNDISAWQLFSHLIHRVPYNCITL